MIGDALVFDCVAHVFNFDEGNTLGDAGKMFNNHLYAFHQALTPADEPHLSTEEFLREWTVEEIDRMVYEESDTDMLLAMPLPLTDMFKDGLSSRSSRRSTMSGCPSSTRCAGSSSGSPTCTRRWRPR